MVCKRDSGGGGGLIKVREYVFICRVESKDQPEILASSASRADVVKLWDGVGFPESSCAFDCSWSLSVYVWKYACK